MNDAASAFALDPSITYLNHGSFGACPRAVLQDQRRWRDELEAEPVRFMLKRLPEVWEHSRVALSEFVGADPEGIVFVDGAHGPGMLPLELDRLGAAFYAGNLHKWICAPKSAAFLHARADRREGLRPAVISHGANAPIHSRSRFHLEFD
ncbi:MAG: hypothetical protein V3W41_11105 [Planctomycetota bacterium]